MGTPHKHAALIKAWADGAIIEYKNMHGRWELPAGNPIWHNDIEYRIKPKTIKYRLYLNKWDKVCVSMLDCEDILCYFVRWLTDEQEIEV